MFHRESKIKLHVSCYLLKIWNASYLSYITLIINLYRDQLCIYTYTTLKTLFVTHLHNFREYFKQYIVIYCQYYLENIELKTGLYPSVYRSSLPDVGVPY